MSRLIAGSRKDLSEEEKIHTLNRPVHTPHIPYTNKGNSYQFLKKHLFDTKLSNYIYRCQLTMSGDASVTRAEYGQKFDI